MKITNEFTVHTPIDRAWKVLTDLEFTIKAAAGQYYTTDQASADKFRQSLRRLGLEEAQ